MPDYKSVDCNSRYVTVVRAAALVRRWLPPFVVCFAAGISSAPTSAQPIHRVLILDQGDFTRPYRIAQATAIRAALTNDPSQPIETYTEALDTDRFPGDAHKKNLLRWLKIKYHDRKIDAIVTEGPEALDFAIDFRAEMAQMTPIVFTAIEQYYVGRMSIPPMVTGVAAVTSLRQSVEQALQIVPGTKRTMLLGDAGSEGSYLVDISREFVEIQRDRELNVMTGMPVATLLGKLSSLPQDAVIIYLGISTDSTGQYYVPAELLATITRVANRPIFVTTDDMLGSGAIGGLIMKSTDGAQEVAGMVKRVLNGENASTIPIQYRDYRHPTYDFKVMKKWGIQPNHLPEGTILLNRDPTLWEQYSTQIVIVVLVLILQTALIVALIFEYRRRRKAEMRFRRSMSDFAHMSRTTALGELSASIAHELNQPLAAIMSNADAIDVLIGADPLPLSEIRHALADIIHDDQRASDIIVSMRSLFRKDELELKAVDLNRVIDAVVSFIRWEAHSKSVEIIVEQERNLPSVLGEPAQLNQVILNLLLNGIDAVQNGAAGTRAVKIATEIRDEKMVHVCVEDTGPGIPPEMIEKIFDPYYTTKIQGMGMGLSISRTIIEAHGGLLVAENIDGGGARLSLSLTRIKPK